MISSLLSFIPLVAVVLFDMQNVLSHDKRRILYLSDEATDDYTILIPLYGNPKYFDGREQIEQFKDNVVVICDIGTDEMKMGVERLEAEGWRTFTCQFDKPTAPMLMKAALDSGIVTTKFSVRLDADTVVENNLGNAVAAVEKAGADIASTKCHILNPRNLCERMQAQEYEMAMLSRHYRPWLLSGACYIALTSSLKAILNEHTLWFLSEDSEAGRVAWQRKMKIRHVQFEVFTEPPHTWRGWFRQRTRIWWAGSVRHVWINFDHNVLKMPVWTFYYAALVWVGLTWKWSSFITLFEYWPRGLAFLFFLFGIYTVITFISNWQVRSRYMFLIPYYSLFQSTVMPPLGLFFYIRYAWTHKKFGRYKFTYRRRFLLPEFRRIEGNAESMG